MKNLKKNLFGMGLAFSVMLGAAFSVAPEVATANIIDEGGDKITCWSAGTSPLISFRRYVECASCTSVKGRGTGGKGECTN